MKTTAERCFLWLATIILCMVAAKGQQNDTLGQITNKMIRCGDTLRFRVVSSSIGDSVTGTRFRISEPAPITPFRKPTIDSISGLFTYICDSTDVDPFTITVYAQNSNLGEQQTIEISPLPILPPEITTFGLVPNSKWNPLDPSKQIISYQSGKTSTKNVDSVVFNAHKRGSLSDGLIVGREIVFEKGSEFYERYSMGGGRYDLKNLTIAAERVIFRDTTIFRGTNVRIQAREIRFEDRSSSNRAILVTTPLNFGSGLPGDKDPADPETNIRGEVGNSGTNGGSIDISAEYLIARGNVVRFVMNGGNGQSSARKQGASADPPAGRGGDGGSFIASACKDTNNKPVDFQTLIKNDPGSNGFTGNILDTQAGTPSQGAITVNPSDNWSWFNPYVLRLKLSFAKDCYRERYLEYSYKQLGEIRDFINSIPPPVVSALDGGKQREIQCLLGEVDALQYRIANNMDYYGFPAGWVPMISLNTAKSLYASEISYAMNAMFLSTWINGIADSLNARIDGLKAVREALIDQVDGYQVQYSTAISTLGTLYTESDSTLEETKRTQESFAARQRQLQEMARNIVADRHKPKKLKGWQRIAKIAGTVAQFSPFFQPAAGLVGQGLIIASEYDKNDKWATLEKLKGLNATFKELGGFGGVMDKTTNDFGALVKSFDVKQFSRDLKNLKSEADFKKLSQRVTSFYAEQDKQFGITNSVRNIKQALRQMKEQTQVSADEVGAEMSRLMAEDPAYNSMMNQLAELQVKSERITRQISENTEATFSNYSKINANINAVDALNLKLDATLADIDPKVIAYSKDLERDAYDRMNKYHYYIAKAYEYQFLKPYTMTMERDKIIDKIKEFANNAKVAGKLTDDNIQSLRAVYEEVLAKLKEDITTAIAEGRQIATGDAAGRDWKVPVSILKQLKSGQAVEINFAKTPDADGNYVLDRSWENVVIDSISFKYVHLDKNYNRPLTYKIQHSGISEKIYRGKRYLFRHYVNPAAIGAEETTVLEWGGIIQPNTTYPQYFTTFNDEMVELLRTVGEAQGSKQYMFVKPSATANLILCKGGEFPDEINADSMVLSLAVRYTQAKLDGTTRRLNVAVSNDNLQPLIKLGKPENQPWVEDNQLRQNGRGKFTRTYATNDKVSIEAPARFGYWVFNQWRQIDQDGRTIFTTGKPKTDVSMSENKSFVADYQIPYSISADGIVAVGLDGTVRKSINTKDTLVLTIPARISDKVIIDMQDTEEGKIFLEQSAVWGFEPQDSAASDHKGFKLENNVLILDGQAVEDEPVTVYAAVDYGGARHYLNRTFMLSGGVVSVNDDKPIVAGFSNPVTVFPNPSTDNCTVRFTPETKGHVDIGVYSTDGREVLSVFRGHVSQDVLTLGLRLNELPAGSYIVRCITAAGEYSTKLSVIH